MPLAPLAHSWFGDSSLTLDWMIHRLQLVAFNSQFEASWEQRASVWRQLPSQHSSSDGDSLLQFLRDTSAFSAFRHATVFTSLPTWGENHSWHAIRLQWVHVLAKTSLRDLRHCCEDLCLCPPRCKDPDQYPPLQPAALSALNERVKWWFLCAMSNAIITHHLRLTVESVRDIHMKGGSILRHGALEYVWSSWKLQCGSGFPFSFCDQSEAGRGGMEDPDRILDQSKSLSFPSPSVLITYHLTILRLQKQGINMRDTLCFVGRYASRCFRRWRHSWDFRGFSP